MRRPRRPRGGGRGGFRDADCGCHSPDHQLPSRPGPHQRRPVRTRLASASHRPGCLLLPRHWGSPRRLFRCSNCRGARLERRPIAVVERNQRDLGQHATGALLAMASGRATLLPMSDELALDELWAAGPGVTITGWDGTREASAAGIWSVTASVREQGRVSARAAIGGTPLLRRFLGRWARRGREPPERAADKGTWNASCGISIKPTTPQLGIEQRRRHPGPWHGEHADDDDRRGNRHQRG